VYDNAPSHVCKSMDVECVNNDEFCLSRFSEIKKAAKKMEFEYRCFPCRKQDDKARSYTRSYDLILHMVNTHTKYATSDTTSTTPQMDLIYVIL